MGKGGQRLAEAKTNLEGSAASLDRLRSQMLLVDEALQKSAAEIGIKHLSTLCIKTCRELAIQMRSDARKASPENMGLLKRAGLGTAALASWVIVGASTGAAGALVTESLRKDAQAAVVEVEGSCRPGSVESGNSGDLPIARGADRALNTSHDKGDVAIRRAMKALQSMNLVDYSANDLQTIRDIGDAIEETAADAAIAANSDDGSRRLLSNFAPELEAMRSSWANGDADAVSEASAQLISRLEHYR